MSYAFNEHHSLPWNHSSPRSFDIGLQGQRTTALPHLSHWSVPSFPSAALPLCFTSLWSHYSNFLFFHLPLPPVLALVFANKGSHSFTAKSAVPSGSCSKTQLLEELETWSSNSLIPFLKTKHKHFCSGSWCILHECPVIFICFVHSSLLLLLVLQKYHVEMPSFYVAFSGLHQVATRLRKSWIYRPKKIFLCWCLRSPTICLFPIIPLLISVKLIG